MTRSLVPVADTPRAPRTTLDRARTLGFDTVDAIVVGAGAGGLTTAALLARRGLSVLVLERRDVAGGSLNTCRRPGYAFDAGAQYIGDCGPGGSVPRILRAAGATDGGFLEMDPDGYDTFCFPDFTFRMPRGVERFRARLLERFPHEAPGIDRYLTALTQIWALQSLRGRPAVIMGTLWRSRAALPAFHGTVERFLNTCTRDSKLRAVLTAQGGEYAEPPSRAPLLTHATVQMSYLQGAYYPAGGPEALSRRLVSSIERHGGTVLLRTTVTRILVQRGRVTGVEFESAQLGRRTVRTPVIVSDTGLERTYLGLVGVDQLRAKTVRRVRGDDTAPRLGAVYLGVKRDLRAEGIPNTNFWVHPSYDPEALYAEARAGRFCPEPACFISPTSLKDPTNPRLAPPGITNVQIKAVVPSQPEAWGTTTAEIASGAYVRNPAYRWATEAFADRLLGVAERVLPGLRRDVVYLDAATPISHAHLTGSTGGAACPNAALPHQALFHRPCAAAEIKGLYVCGAATRTGHDVVSTMWSGAVAASEIAGVGVLRDVMDLRPAG